MIPWHAIGTHGIAMVIGAVIYKLLLDAADRAVRKRRQRLALDTIDLGRWHSEGGQ